MPCSTPTTRARAVAAIAEQLHGAIRVFASMDAPLICAVNGTAAGAGFSLAVSADLVIAFLTALNSPWLTVRLV